MDSKTLKRNLNNNIIIATIPPLSSPCHQYSFIDEKTIKYIEKIIRGSLEYREFIKYLKTTLDVSSCTFYEGYSLANGLGVEIHHSPLTLYQYVETICRKHLKLNNGYYDALDVAEEVTKLHFQFLVGLVPLNPTAHKLVHTDNLKIHPDLIIGGWKIFLEDYKEWLSESIENTLAELDEIKKNPSNEIPKILIKKELYLSTPFVKLKDNLMNDIVNDKIKKLGEIK